MQVFAVLPRILFTHSAPVLRRAAEREQTPPLSRGKLSKRGGKTSALSLFARQATESDFQKLIRLRDAAPRFFLIPAIRLAQSQVVGEQEVAFFHSA